MDLTGALTSATAALNLLKTLKDVDNSLENAEYKAKMAELYVAVADMRMALSDAREEIHGKDLEIAGLIRRLQEREELVVIDGFSFGVAENGAAVGLAFCPSCDGKLDKRVQLIDAPAYGKTKCPVCEKVFEESKTKQGMTIRESQPSATTVRVRRSSRLDGFWD